MFIKNVIIYAEAKYKNIFSFFNTFNGVGLSSLNAAINSIINLEQNTILRMNKNNSIFCVMSFNFFEDFSSIYTN